MNKKKVAFDLDGVCIDFYTPTRNSLLEQFGFDLYTKNHRFDIATILPDSIKNKEEFMNEFFIENAHIAKPYLYTQEALERYFEYIREPLQFITARNPVTQDVTYSVMKNILSNIPFQIHFYNCCDKVFQLKHLNMDTLVEDRLRTANHVAKEMGESFLINRPWNIGREVEVGVHRYNNVLDLVNEITQE